MFLLAFHPTMRYSHRFSSIFSQIRSLLWHSACPLFLRRHFPKMRQSARQGRLPKWLRRPIPKSNANHLTQGLLDELRLETVCDNAKCPNRMECYSQQTATFMILGNVCTRPCGFCAVHRGKPPELPEQDEPTRVAEAAARLGLKHVVITSVTRDDLPDGGAEHFYQCVVAVRERTGATTGGCSHPILSIVNRL